MGVDAEGQVRPVTVELGEKVNRRCRAVFGLGAEKQTIVAGIERLSPMPGLPRAPGSPPRMSNTSAPSCAESRENARHSPLSTSQDIGKPIIDA